MLVAPHDFNLVEKKLYKWLEYFKNNYINDIFIMIYDIRIVVSAWLFWLHVKTNFNSETKNMHWIIFLIYFKVQFKWMDQHKNRAPRLTQTKV